MIDMKEINMIASCLPNFVRSIGRIDASNTMLCYGFSAFQDGPGS